MPDEKRQTKELLGKMVVTKEGKNLGEVLDVTFETRTGELVSLLLKNPTKYALQIGIEKHEDGKAFAVPFNSIIAVGDFVVVAEEDLL